MQPTETPFVPETTFIQRHFAAIIAGFILVIIIAIGGPWLDHYLHTGKIVVTAAGKITITPAGNTLANNSSVRSGTGAFTVSVPDGKYFVSVSSQSGEIDQFVTITGHETVRLNPAIPASAAVEPVSYGKFSDVSADSSHLVFLDSGKSGINFVNTNNTDTYVPNTQYFLSAQWASPEFGVGLSELTNGLFVIKNGVATSLPSAASGSNATGAVYSVAPDDTIYIGLGSTLYRGTSSGVYAKIYDNLPSGAALEANNNGVAVIENGYNGSAQISFINSSGLSVNKKFSGLLSGWSAWSPGGKFLAVAVGSKNEIFNTSLQQVATIPQANLSPLSYASWLNDNTLIYSVGKQLWQYNLTQQSTQVIGNIPSSEQVQGLSVSLDGSYAYVVAASSSTGVANEIMRVGLKNQQPSAAVLSLAQQNVFPLITDSYVANLMNFAGKPTVVILTILPLNSGQKSSVIQSVKQSLQKTTDTSGLNFYVQQLS